MKYYKEDVIRILTLIAEKVKENTDTLSNLDGLSGDGDLGESMEKSSNAVLETVNSAEYRDIGELLMKCSMAMNKAAPSTLGTLLSGAVMAAAKDTKGKTELETADICRIPKIMADSIKEKGKADLGDKTILDALIPMCNAVSDEFEGGSDLKRCFHMGAEAAKKGADRTVGMLPKAGRAQWIGERVRENQDGGAVLCAMVAELFRSKE